ncbi:MAG TPA: ImmA/IrrE family metallo-endopeptidase [Bauldia sp.]|nr:ImmA/IrrE family metallo-endopeptidase [Bauldia sp.]
MTQKIKEGIALDALDAFLVEDLLAQSDMEILAEFEAVEGDANAHAQTMRELFERVVVASNKSRLVAARAGAAAIGRTEIATAETRITDIAMARKRLAEAAADSSRKVSLAARNETLLSDSDVLGLVEDLDILEARASRENGEEKNRRKVRPDSLLKGLGITEPEEIDLEAIGFCVHAVIKYRALQGCDAQIVGYGNDAIITVNCDSSDERRRFSAAHEIGHWMLHRGKQLACRVDEASNDGSPSEREADRFAADLLMPIYIFERFAREFERLNFDVVKELASRFATSITSTAIRLIEIDHSPALLVCHGPEGRRWFRRAPSVPAKWFPMLELGSESSAFSVLFGRQTDDLRPRKIQASLWFDTASAGYHSVHEQTTRIGKDEVLTLLIFDPSTLAERL